MQVGFLFVDAELQLFSVTFLLLCDWLPISRCCLLWQAGNLFVQTCTVTEMSTLTKYSINCRNVFCHFYTENRNYNRDLFLFLRGAVDIRLPLAMCSRCSFLSQPSGLSEKMGRWRYKTVWGLCFLLIHLSNFRDSSRGKHTGSREKSSL